MSLCYELEDFYRIPYRLGPMGTCVEGEWDEVMGLLKNCFDVMRKDCRRITISLKADFREGLENRLQGKIESVEKYLGRKLR